MECILYIYECMSEWIGYTYIIIWVCSECVSNMSNVKYLGMWNVCKLVCELVHNYVRGYYI